MPTLDEIDAQIRALEEQKNQLKQKAKEVALKKANEAIEELRAMGYNYRLAEMGGLVATPRETGKRRTGVRDQVLNAVKDAGGATAAQVLEALNASSDTEKTSIRNALAALKKSGTLTLNDGVYSAA